jgi:hypothetical protein
VAKDPRLAQLDKNTLIEKIKKEGILNDIISTLPIATKRPTSAAMGQTPAEALTAKVHVQEQVRLESKTPSSLAAKMHGRTTPSYTLEPNKRYLSIRMVHLRALVDYVNPREDEFIYVTISFLKQRFQTGALPAQAEVAFSEDDGSFLFDFSHDEAGVLKFDPAMLLKLNQTVHLTICKQRKNEKAVVLGTKNLDWRAVLHSSSIEINAEVLPVDLAKQGAMCVAQLHVDLLPPLSKQEALSEEAVSKQQSLERKFESESL